jgi:hypothetical protein
MEDYHKWKKFNTDINGLEGPGIAQWYSIGLQAG